MTGWGRDFIHDASSPGSCPSDFLSTSPVSGAKAQAFIERAWTSGPTKEVALFIGSPFHGCGVAVGGLGTAIVGLIRGYACRRGFRLLMSCSYCLLGAFAFQSAQRVLRWRCIVLGCFRTGIVSKVRSKAAIDLRRPRRRGVAYGFGKSSGASD